MRNAGLYKALRCRDAIATAQHDHPRAGTPMEQHTATTLVLSPPGDGVVADHDQWIDGEPRLGPVERLQQNPPDWLMGVRGARLSADQLG